MREAPDSTEDRWVCDSVPSTTTSRSRPVPQRVPSRNASLYLDTRFYAGGPHTCRQECSGSKH
jgi:hypothetical protein